MQANLKKFIEEHIDLIESFNFTDLYILAKQEIPFQIGNLTTNLRDAGIDPLEHLNRVVPEMFSNSMIKQIELPKHITKIKSQAFLDCFQLISIVIPESVTFIHETAFKGCYELREITYRGTKEQWHHVYVSDKIFTDCATDIVVCNDGEVHLSQDEK